jgi:hypothetical protein
MKLAGHNTELVREYIKQWAWDGIKPNQYDQPYIFGKQSKAEARMYSKVDYVVTDCPLYLSPIYELYHSGGSIILPSVHAFMTKARENGVSHHNFLLTRKKSFDSRGRYETEDQAKEVDELVKQYLTQWGITYTEVTCPEEERVDFIINKVVG